ncbi:WG repeat-containing protein [Caballeronia sp. ATUFL_M2_KS44]|uniref:WG repeat-containing protein n=1 Tax=Caballeronia sp. ATUFL_M2_KS44 TaxID=2921767 RepID=UPI00202810F8|nr:WG repeat-containing protein [Caballeronia sp. ATUFL_M2_KS44]
MKLRDANIRPIFLSLCVGLLAACSSKTETKTHLPSTADFNVAVCVNGACGLIDQNASELIPFTKGEPGLVTFPMQGTMLLKYGNKLQLVDQKSRKVIKSFGGDFYEATPGYFGFLRGDKFGVANFKGDEIQPPRFDSVFPGGENQYIGFEIGQKRGMLKADGTTLTGAEFDSTEVLGDPDKHAGWVVADSGDEHWIVNVHTGARKKAAFRRIDDIGDDHMVVSMIRDGYGLIDSQGKQVLPRKFEWLGTPGGGLVAYREGSSAPCGYMDYAGKTVIAPKYRKCGTFGKRAALVQPQRDQSDDDNKYIAIDKSGRQILQTEYTDTAGARRTIMGNVSSVPGYEAVFTSTGLFSWKAGIFNLDEAREEISPVYYLIGIVAPDRYVFSKEGKPAINTANGSEPLPTIMTESELLGLMDRSGTVLVKPDRYIQITLDKSGKYLRALSLNGEALLDLNGNTLIAPQWDKLVIDEAKGAIFGYTVYLDGMQEQKTLRAAYDLNGNTLFSVTRAACGAQQLVDGAGNPVWPKDVRSYCSTESDSTDAKS